MAKATKVSGKWCWVATETPKGWRVKFEANGSWTLRGALFNTEKDVSRVIGTDKIVFVHMANSPKKPTTVKAANKPPRKR